MVEVLHFLGHVEAQDDLVSHQDLIFDVTDLLVTSALQYARPYVACNQDSARGWPRRASVTHVPQGNQDTTET
jgi:hypothetical protein